MTAFVVTELEMPSCNHLAYHCFEMPTAAEKGGYKQITSYTAFFHGNREYNRRPDRLFYAQRRVEWELPFKNSVFGTQITELHAAVPRIQHASLWDFYKAIRWDWRTKKWL